MGVAEGEGEEGEEEVGGQVEEGEEEAMTRQGREGREGHGWKGTRRAEIRRRRAYDHYP